MPDASDRQFNERFITSESVRRLNARLCIAENPFSQDWEIENSDSGRIEEFLTLYEQLDLNDDDRFALMALIVASFDDCLLEDKATDSVKKRVREYLVRDWKLHNSTIHYWCVEGESDPEFMFRTTAFMRDVWRIVVSNKVAKSE